MNTVAWEQGCMGEGQSAVFHTFIGGEGRVQCGKSDAGREQVSLRGVTPNGVTTRQSRGDEVQLASLFMFSGMPATLKPPLLHHPVSVADFLQHDSPFTEDLMGQFPDHRAVVG